MDFRWVSRLCATTAVALAAATITASGAPAASATNTITVTAQEYSFSVSGTARPGVATINFHDAGTSWHQMAMIRLKPGVTLDQVKTALVSPDPNAFAQIAADPMTTNYGGPGLVSPSKTVTVTVPDLAAGTYAIACFVTAADGAPHFLHGMLAMLTVGGKKYTTAPKTDGTIKLTDKSVVATKKLATTGTHIFKVVNASALPRSFAIGKPNAGATFAQVTDQINTAFQNNKSFDDAPGAVVASIDSLSPGQASYLVVKLAKGSYGDVTNGLSASGPPPPGSTLLTTFTVK